MTLLFSYNGADVNGIVQQSNTAAKCTTVALVPQTFPEDDSGIYFGSCAADGSFSLKHIRPNRYRAYAFEEIDRGKLLNPDFRKRLEPNGTSIELKECEKLTIRLPLTTSAGMQAVYPQIGLDIQ